MCDTFFDAVLALCYAKFGNAVVQLLLFDGVEALPAVVEGPVGIDAVAAVIGSLALAAGDVVAVDDGVSFMCSTSLNGLLQNLMILV